MIMVVGYEVISPPNFPVFILFLLFVNVYQYNNFCFSYLLLDVRLLVDIILI